jgi:acetoin utilization protein AcuC
MLDYGFPEGHPLDPVRLRLTIELMRSMGLVADADVVEPRAATDAELTAVHSVEYVEAVKRFSAAGQDPTGAERWGLGTEDVPIVEGMDAAARLIVGATLVAAEQVMSGACVRAFQPGGGLHHAHRARAAGFCVYNDLAVAIAWVRRRFGARVMYVDYDAHHGDGVQEAFWDDPEVLTVSFHESGTYLFPGTGWIDEQGGGGGHGYAVNVPLDAYTGDDSYYQLFSGLVPDLAEAFRPDVIVLQNGCDAHFQDPLAHLRCSTGLFERFVRVVDDVADRHCDGRIIATGGGGYSVYDVVPRAWTLVWAALKGEAAPDAIPREWLDSVLARYGVLVPPTLRDPPGTMPASPREAEADANNLRTLQAVRRQALPLLTGWSLGF